MSAINVTMHDMRFLWPCAMLGFLLFFFIETSVVLGLAVVLVLGLIALVVRWPELGTLTVLFAIYSNIAVIGMKTRAGLSASVETSQTTISTAGQNSRVVVVMAALCLLLCVPLIYQFLIRKQKITFDRGFYLILGYFTVFLASSFFSRDGKIITSEIIDFLVEGVAIYFLVFNVVREYATLRRATWALLLAGSLMGGLSVFQHVTHTQNSNYGGLAMLGAELDFNPAGSRERARPGAVVSNFNPEGATNTVVGSQFRSAGPIGEPNRYAQVLIVLFPLAALRFRRERSRALRWLAVACAALIFGGLMLTFSRGAMVTAVILFLLLIYFRFIKPLQVVAAVSCLALLVLSLDPQAALRFASLGGAESLLGKHDTSYDFRESVQGAPDSSVVRRYVLDVATWHVFLDHPILGVGPGHFAEYYSIPYSNRVGLIEQLQTYRGHNLYFETLAETGILGLLAFLTIMVGILHSLWRAWKRWQLSEPEFADTAIAFFVSLVGYLISAVFAHLSYQRYFWLLVALCSATVHILRRHEMVASGE